jgi:hypothetical protein
MRFANSLSVYVFCGQNVVLSLMQENRQSSWFYFHNYNNENKRAMMAQDRSPNTTASKQCLKQGSWPSMMTTESKM